MVDRERHRKLALIGTMERTNFCATSVRFSDDNAAIISSNGYEYRAQVMRFFGRYCSNFSANGDAGFWRKEWLVIHKVCEGVGV